MSTKTLRKRIALVAVSALGFGLVSAAPSSAADNAATVTISPVRVSFTGGTQDSVSAATVTVATGALVDADVTDNEGVITVTLTTAPSAAAVLTVADPDFTDQGTVGGTDTSAQLGDNGVLKSSGTDTLATAADLVEGLTFAVNTIGTYVGTIQWLGETGGNTLTAPFSFTTTGAPASLVVSASAETVSPSGTSTITATLKDAAGLTTQGSTVDSIAFSAATGTLGTASLDAAALADGTGTSVLTAASTSGTAHVVTITPQGTLGGLGVKTLTVTTDATVIYATTDADIAFTVSAPADAATVTGTVDGGDRAQSVRTGSSAITVKVSSATASKTLRFKITASAGTVDGVAYTTPVYKNIATDADGIGYVSFTLGGGALLNTATATVEQVTVVNALINPAGAGDNTDIVITQADSAVSASTLSMGIAGSVVRALGTVTSVDVTVKDQFAGALGAGWTVRAYRTSVSAANLLSTATTNASGVATVSVSALSTVVTGGSETYVYTADYPGVTQITTASTAAKNLTVTYTTTGGITSLSVAIAGSNGDLATALGSADTTITDTEATVTAAFPVVYVPSSGTVTEGSAQTAVATLAGVVTAGSGAVSNTFRLAADATANNTSTYTTTEGAYVAAAAGGAWNAGLSTLTVAEGTTVYVFATKTGLHTVTVTSGDKTVTIKFWAKNQATDYYTVSAVADSSSLLPSANSVVTVTVKDIFGNVVDAADGLLTATAADKVRLAGQALSQSLNTTAAGTSAFTIIADAATGTGTITIAPTATGAQAWLSTYVAPTGAAAPVSSATVTITVAGVAGKSAAELAADAATAAVTALEAKLAAEKVAADAAAATAKAESDAKLAALQAALDAAAVKAAADKAEAEAAAKVAAEAAAVKAAADKEATEAAIQAATDAATEALDAANAATDAANASAEAGDAATAAAQDAADAVAALSTQVSEMITALKKQITALTNLVIKIQKKVKA